MGWNGSLSSSSAIGSSITFTSETTAEGAYTVGSFTAPKAGVYKFTLYGSGGRTNTDVATEWYESRSDGGVGGTTVGYINMSAGQVVYIGVGGTRSAAFVSNAWGAALKDIAVGNVYLIAGGGGCGGAMWGQRWGNKSGAGGAGGGSSGGHGISADQAAVTTPGTQTSGYAYGVGGGGVYSNDGYSNYGGAGGDGLYGGHNGGWANGGGGGSGYVWTSSISVGGSTYTNSTTQGGGAASDNTGSVVVTYMASSMLPIYYNGTQLSKIVYNGTTLTSLVYNGTKLF